jgi:hypothetical protein
LTPAIVRRVSRYQKRWWYLPLLAALAAADLFVGFIPTDALVVSAAMLRPRKWLRSAVIIALGSAVGALALAWAIHVVGDPVLTWLFGTPEGPAEWKDTKAFLERYGAPALALMAGGPLPQQPAVALCSLGGMRLDVIALSVLAGRLIKYCVFAYSATHARRFLRKRGKPSEKR